MSTIVLDFENPFDTVGTTIKKKVTTSPKFFGLNQKTDAILCYDSKCSLVGSNNSSLS